MKELKVQPLTKEAFAPFGQVIETEGAKSFLINNDNCRRHHDLATVETAGPNGHTLINIFRGQPYTLPLDIKLVEKHPFGSQAFMPLTENLWLVVVAKETETGPDDLYAFLPKPGQGVSYNRNTWHAVLTPLDVEADFLVVDRGGDGDNLVEHTFEEPFRVTAEAIEKCKN
ncbi:MAG: ureidoglycolate lyase [Alphaproteobacteria bacterium]